MDYDIRFIIIIITIITIITLQLGPIHYLIKIQNFKNTVFWRQILSPFQTTGLSKGPNFIDLSMWPNFLDLYKGSKCINLSKHPSCIDVCKGAKCVDLSKGPSCIDFCMGFNCTHTHRFFFNRDSVSPKCCVPRLLSS
jgi:hypothetical protein